jgi:DNA polymerase I-like protein with 3'-5' exonuclease and polymerase domains
VVKTTHQLGQLGLFRPESEWSPPRELPDIRGADLLAIDTEGRDDGLATGRGPGWPLGPAGYLCGISYAVDDRKGYIPIRHPETNCFDPDQSFRWANDVISSAKRVVFHNAPFDIGWLSTEGVDPPEVIEDTSAAAVMLDENHRSYSLDSCLAREGLELKNKALLQKAAEAFGGDVKNPAKTIYLYPGKFVGPYAEDDAARTLDLFRRYEPQLLAQGVWNAYRLEMDLIPMVVAMRRRGIRIDTVRAEEIAQALRMNVQRLCRIAGERLPGRRAVTINDLRSPEWLARAFTSENLSFPRTGKTKQGSFSKDWMQKSSHWLPRLVVEARHYEDAASKQIENFILGFAHRGRLHAEVHQFLTDEGGTRSQRFSYSSPPLQQMEGVQEGPDDKPVPAGDEPWQFYGGVGGAIRGVFLPEKDTAWGAFDYSQQEPRLTVHFAAVTECPGVEEALRRYNENPRQDREAAKAI